MPELKKYQMFIDGEWVDSDTKKTFETLNPENNKPWAIVPEASANDVDKAVKAAQKAFEGEWPNLLPRERAKYIRAIGNKLRENAELLGKLKQLIQVNFIEKHINRQIILQNIMIIMQALLIKLKELFFQLINQMFKP